MKKGTEILSDAGTGDGAVDAAMKAIDRITGQHGHLMEYQVRAVTQGKDAIGEVTLKVQFEKDGELVSGKASTTDVIEASARAYLNAVNRWLQLKQDAKGRPCRSDTP